ncbi:MAG: hypothetical protein CVU32_03895 [Betaproteobacteria bacterium HGW-Betaproteobacteria-5]|nr:MAG: hypothetical protein CVU32_03895 [Betaproteobacteria bacterium HGW-Betaproteobacteria-5]
MPNSSIRPPVFHSSRLGKVLHFAYVALAALVAATAFHAWQLRCEGFGCMGIGVVWIGWVVAIFTPTLVLGIFLATKSGPRDWLSALTRYLIWAQITLGVALFIYWAIAIFHH